MNPEINSNYIDIEVDLNSPCFDWSIKPLGDQLDWSKLQYNNIYKSYDYFESRFSGDYSHILGFDKIIEKMANHSLTPLEEMEQRKYDAVVYNNNDQK
jgi:hypothetical protein